MRSAEIEVGKSYAVNGGATYEVRGARKFVVTEVMSRGKIRGNLHARGGVQEGVVWPSREFWMTWEEHLKRVERHNDNVKANARYNDEHFARQSEAFEYLKNLGIPLPGSLSVSGVEQAGAGGRVYGHRGEVSMSQLADFAKALLASKEA